MPSLLVRVANPDYSVFDCGGVALSEAEVRVTIEVVPLLNPTLRSFGRELP
jgi:hypothetical protein